MSTAPDSTGAGRSRDEWNELASSARYDLVRSVVGERLLEPNRDFSRTLGVASNISDRCVAAVLNFIGQPQVLEISNTHLYSTRRAALESISACLISYGAGHIGLLTPTSGRTAAFLEKALGVIPVSERVLDDIKYAERVVAKLDALFVCLPNNPTGRTCTNLFFRELASLCARSNAILVVDCRYRMYAPLDGLYDELCRVDGLMWCVIEDAGEQLGVSRLELKVVCTNMDPLPPCISDVSPALEEVQMLARSLQSQLMTEYASAMRAIVEANRHSLHLMIDDRLPVREVNRSSKLGVAWLELPSSANSDQICNDLLRSSAPALPGGYFFWDNPSHGRRYLRVALLRDPKWFREASSVWQTYLAWMLDE